ncbi:ROK family protein [Micromonospora sp. NPDC049903]|uniref:ROK family protein n=1 Tax=Micromonospora sp. NPDC049903 TaxID=3364276 RepID=UPI00379DD0E1
MTTAASSTAFLGIDIGGTKVALRAEADGRKPYLATVTWPPGDDRGRDLAALAAQVRELTEAWGPVIRSVGVAMPATTHAGRVTAWPGRPGWTGLDLDATLADLFPQAQRAWADDGDLAAIAEADAAGVSHAVYLGVGTGIGGGVVLAGQPVPGPRGSCEVGHIVVDLDGTRCDCGRRGCVQALASGPATLRRAAELRGSPVGFAELRDAVAAGAEWATGAVRASARALAAAAVSLSELVRPSVLIIGGGFAAGTPGYVDQVAAATAALARPGHRTPPVAAATLGGLSSLHGALLLARARGELLPPVDPS